ncbi:hypothetical protein [Nocardia farcinica]|uniref:hypothetical protein n=1 Tax=Nocardia farcinica TaxID=37329 RepID=UPI0024573A0E|nr:hypothetical protein [Nocardia farcinica]
MISAQAQAALSTLHERAKKTSDNFELERIDRALDEIIRLNSVAPAAFQVRSAMAHASKVLLDRRALAPSSSVEEFESGREPGQPEGRFAVVDLAAWLQTTRSLTDAQRRLVHQLAADLDVEDLASVYGVMPARLRERISRTRKAARTAYAAEVTVA